MPVGDTPKRRPLSARKLVNVPRLPPSFRLRSRYRTPALAAVFLALWPAAGCTTAPRPAPPPSPQAVELAAGRYTDAFDAAVETLRRSGFRIDRADHRFGVVTTRPEGSPTLFEPWLTGNTSRDTRLLSTLNDVRRTITVTFDAAPDTADHAGSAPAPGPQVNPPSAARRMSVAVELELFQAPGRRLDGRTDGRVFSDPPRPRSADEDDADNQDIPNAWKAIGRDPGLEALLQQRILDRLNADLKPDPAVDPAAG